MTIEQTVAKMLITSTGRAMGDSGGENGRAWEQLRIAIGIPLDKKITPADISKAIAYLDRQPKVIIDDWCIHDKADDDTITSDEVMVSVSTYHHLVDSLELDTLCHEFNARPVRDWDSDAAYGLSKSGEQWLLDHGFTITSPDKYGYNRNTWNSYNGESTLEDTLQGCNLYRDVSTSLFEFPDYVLLQIHRGADVRGGYTDAKLFKINDEYFTANPDADISIGGHDLTTSYNGWSLTTYDGDEPELKVSDIRKATKENA